MQVEQAVYTSARTRNLRGYHLVARSEGIDEELASTLSVWGPSHGSLADSCRNTESLNVFPAGRGRIALSRTVFGGPEYSGRGGLQVVTRILVFRSEQLAGYEYDTVALTRTVLALGHLRLQAAFSRPMPRIDLPDETMTGLPYARHDAVEESDVFFTDLRRILSTGGQVAVVGNERPLSLLEQLIRSTPGRERLELSFTTGLNPSVHRPFRMHFLQNVDDDMRYRLETRRITYIGAEGQVCGVRGS